MHTCVSACFMASRLGGRVCSVAEALSAGAWHDTFVAVGRRSSDPDACSIEQYHGQTLANRSGLLFFMLLQRRYVLSSALQHHSSGCMGMYTWAAGASQEPAMVGSTCDPDMVPEQEACPSTSAAGSSDPCHEQTDSVLRRIRQDGDQFRVAQRRCCTFSYVLNQGS